MAKINDASDSREIKKLIEGLYAAIQTINSSAKESVKINKELLKAMSLLQSGFVQNETDARQLIDDVNKGLEVTDEFAAKWSKARKATNEDLAKMIKKFRELEEMDLDRIDNAQDYKDLLDLRFDIIEEEFDLTGKIIKNYESIAKAVATSKNAALKLGGSMADINLNVQKMVNKKLDVSQMFSGFEPSLLAAEDLLDKVNSDLDSMIKNASGNIIDIPLNFTPLSGKIEEELATIMEGVNKEKDARLSALDEFFQKNKKLQGQMAKQMASTQLGGSIQVDMDTGDIADKTGKLEEGTLKYQKVVKQLESTIVSNNIGEQVRVHFKEIVDLIGVGTNRTEKQETQLRRLIEPLDLASKLMLEEFDAQQKVVKSIEYQILKQKDASIVLNSYLNQLRSAESAIQKIGQGFDYISALLPAGVGDFLGLSKVSETLLTSHRKGVELFSAEILKGSSNADAMSKYFKEFGPAIASALNPMTLLAASGLLLYKFLQDTVQKYKEIGGEMKVSLLQAKMMYETQLDIISSQKNQFATMEDIQAIQMEMIGSRGKLINLTTKETKELTISLAETGKAFGYGAEQAAKLHKIFRNIGADDKLALNLQQTVGFMTEASGISPQIVGQDLVDASEEVATYFAGMPQKAADAAIETRKMGMSLKQAGEIAQKMLRLDEFMTDMYELQAMTGGGIDFSGAFDKGLMGDIQGMTKDIMNSIGTSAELNQMDYLTRTKIAKTLGMSVEDLSKSVRFNEMMVSLGDSQGKELEKYKDRLGDISNLNQDEIKARLQQLQSTDRLSVAWDKIKAVLIKSLIPLAESFADAIDAVSPFIDFVIMGLKGVGLVLKGLVPLVKGMLAPFKFIGDIISKITGALDESAASGGTLAKVAGSLQSVFDFLGKSVYYIGAGIGTWFAIAKFPSIIGGILSSLGGLLKFIPGIGTLFTALTGNIFGMFSGVPKKAGEASVGIKEPMLAMVGEVKTSLVGMTDSVKQSMSDMVASVKASAAEINKSMQSSVSVGPIIGKAQKMGKTMAEVGQDIADSSQKSSKKLKENIATASVDAVQSLEKVKKKSKSGIIDPKVGAGAFKTVGEIGTKALSMLAVHSALSFFKIRKEGEEQMGQLADGISPMFEMGLTGLAPILTTYLTSGIEKVFTKKLEKKLEDGLLPGIDKVKGKIGSVATVGKTAFAGLKKIAGGMFDGLKNIGSLLSPIDVANQSFDAMGGKMEKIKELIPTAPKSKAKVPKPEEILKHEKTTTEQIDIKKVKKQKTIQAPTIEPSKVPQMENEKPLLERVKNLKNKIEKTKIESPQTEIKAPKMTGDKELVEKIKKTKNLVGKTKFELPKQELNVPELKNDKTLFSKIKGLKDRLFKTKFEVPKQELNVPNLKDDKSILAKVKSLKDKFFKTKFELPTKPLEAPKLEGEKTVLDKIKGLKGRLFKTKFELPKSEIDLPKLKDDKTLVGKLKGLKEKLFGTKMEIPTNPVKLPEVESEKPILKKVKALKDKLNTERLNLPQKSIDLPKVNEKQKSTLMGTVSKVKDFILETFFGFEQTQVDTPNLNDKPLEKGTETLSKKIKGKKFQFGQKSVEVPQLDTKGSGGMTKRFDQLKNIIGNGFSALADILKSAWSTVKSVMTDLISFLSNSLKTLGSGIGDAIKSVLKGIGDGLNAFKTDAFKGAAALLIVSGALWVTSKAMQNFASVKWEDIGKGIVVLGGLTLAVMALGKASGQILIGSAAIAILGASLLPAAYAMEKFNEVEWSSLAKAGVALIGLGVAGTLLAGFAPTMLISAVAVAALGASLIPLTFALEKFDKIGWDSMAKAGVALIGFGAAASAFGLVSPLVVAGSLALAGASVSLLLFGTAVEKLNNSIKGLDPTPLKLIAEPLWNLVQIPASGLVGLSAGILALGTSILGLTALNSVSKVVNSLFGSKSFVNDLEKLAELADPLYLVAKSVQMLAGSLEELNSKTLDLNFDSLKNIQVPEDLDTKIQKKITPTIERIQQESTKVIENRIVQNPFKNQAKVQPPPKSAVAQDVKIQTPPKDSVGQTIKLQEVAKVQPQNQNQEAQKQKQVDIYKEQDMVSDFAPMEFLMRQMLQVLQKIEGKETTIALDGQPIVNLVKKANNNS